MDSILKGQEIKYYREQHTTKACGLWFKSANKNREMSKLLHIEIDAPKTEFKGIIEPIKKPFKVSKKWNNILYSMQ